jgi:hypothetical protein
MQAAWKAGAGDTAKGKGELLYAQK